MKFESHWPKGSGRVSFFKQISHDFLFLALVAILFIGVQEELAFKQIIHGFLFLALVAILFMGAQPFMLFW